MHNRRRMAQFTLLYLLIYAVFMSQHRRSRSVSMRIPLVRRCRSKRQNQRCVGLIRLSYCTFIHILHCVQKKREQNVFCNILYRTRAILIKFVT